MLIIVDAQSKWIEAIPGSSMTATATVNNMHKVFLVASFMHKVFATHSVPKTPVTGNGPSFIAQEFEQFLLANGIKHVLSAPYHPATIGLAERAVQTMKQALVRHAKEKSFEERLAVFLLAYRVTPHSTTGVAPFQLLMRRRLHTRLNRIFQDERDVVERHQKQQTEAHNSHARQRQFAVGDTVYLRSYSSLDGSP